MDQSSMDTATLRLDISEEVNRDTKASNLVATDWALSAADTNQPRWSEIIEEGLIGEQLAAELANGIWQNAEA